MQNNDNQISLPIIRSLKDVELESFTVLFITETLLFEHNSIPYKTSNTGNSEPRHYSVPYTILCHNVVT